MIMFPRYLMLNFPKWLFMIAKVVVHGWGWKVVDVDLAKVVVRGCLVHGCHGGCSWLRLTSNRPHPRQTPHARPPAEIFYENGEVDDCVSIMNR